MGPGRPAMWPGPTQPKGDIMGHFEDRLAAAYRAKASGVIWQGPRRKCHCGNRAQVLPRDAKEPICWEHWNALCTAKGHPVA